jgi:hypothetical protein
MSQSQSQNGSAARRREYETKLALIGLFLALIAAVAPKRREDDPPVGALDWVMLSVASMRAGRLLSYDLVTEPIREPFTETKPDATGAGETVVPEGTGAREALGQLIACPTCSGTWAAAGMAAFLRLAPGPARFFMAILSATGVAELLNALLEALSWKGQVERKEAGSN